MIREWLANFVIVFVSILTITVMVFVAVGELLLLFTLPIGLDILAFAGLVAILSAMIVFANHYEEFKETVHRKIGGRA